MLTLNEIKEWLRIDYEDDDSLLESLIDTSKSIINASCGVPNNFETNTNISEEDINNLKSLYSMTQRILITDLYNEKSVENKALTSLYIQLELEYRRCLKNAES